MSQERLAEKLYVSRKTVMSWENDRNVPYADKITSMCELFGVSADYLLCIEKKQ